MAHVAARVSSKVGTTPAANSKTMVSSSNMGRRRMSATAAMAAPRSAMTAAMSSTGIHWWRDHQKCRHHKGSKR
jgi:hypothetical protein